MSWAIDRSLPWLGYFPLAVDLANTVVVSGDKEIDLLTEASELTTWVEAERARVPIAVAATGHLLEVRALRDAVRDILRAVAQDRPLPAPAVASINRAAARCPSYLTLDAAGNTESTELNDDPFERFCGAVAMSVMDVIVGPGRQQLAVCRAPSCGMLFIRGSARQTWCSAACGNRARVARHAALHRRRRQRAERSSPEV